MATEASESRPVWKAAILTVPAIVIVGTLMGYLSNSGFENSWYADLRKPAFQPPAWMFGVVWTTLELMSGSGAPGSIDAALQEQPDLIVVALAGSNDLSLGTTGATYLMQRYQVFPQEAPPHSTPAPALVGLTEADARSNATALQLALLVEGREPTAGVAAGHRVLADAAALSTVSKRMMRLCSSDTSDDV